MLKAEGKPSGIHVFPPLVILAAVVIASVIDWLVPLTFGLPNVIRWVLGAILFLAPIAVIATLFAAFARVNSAYDVRVVPKGLVTDGLFRFSRNPGYIGMLLMGVGLAILFDDPWAVLALVPAAMILHREVVLKEEAILQREFGEEYRLYKRRVRRWI
jgi:protein-S-isoprenylcysteine O-methyltransferase Ste14